MPVTLAFMCLCADLEATSAADAPAWTQRDESLRRYAFRIVTPGTLKRTAFEEYGRSYSRTIMDAKVLHAEDNAFFAGHRFTSALEGAAPCIRPSFSSGSPDRYGRPIIEFTHSNNISKSI